MRERTSRKLVHVRGRMGMMKVVMRIVMRVVVEIVVRISMRAAHWWLSEIATIEREHRRMSARG